MSVRKNQIKRIKAHFSYSSIKKSIYKLILLNPIRELYKFDFVENFHQILKFNQMSI